MPVAGLDAYSLPGDVCINSVIPAIRQPGVRAIPTAATESHVQDNFRSLSIRFDPEDLKGLDQAFPPPVRKIPLAGW